MEEELSKNLLPLGWERVSVDFGAVVVKGLRQIDGFLAADDC